MANKVTLQPEPTVQFLLEGFSNDITDYIAEQVLPEVPSETLTGYFGRLADGAMRIITTVVKGLAKNIVNYEFDRNASFEVVDHALENPITAAEAERLGGWDIAKQTIGMQMEDDLRRSRENGLAAALTSTSVITHNFTLTGADQWTTKTSEVLSRINVAKAAIEAATGKVANLIILGAPTFRALQFHPEMIAALAPGKATPGIYNEAQMAAAFGVDRVLVGRAIYNSAKEGATATPTFIWGDNCIVAYVSPSALARFAKTLGARVACPKKAPKQYAGSYVPEGKNADQVQVLVVGSNWEDKLITTGAAYLIKDTNA